MLTTDGQNILLQSRDSPRHEVFERLFAGRNIQLDWLSPDYANEIVGGAYRGTLAEVTRAILRDSNFVIIYDADADKYRISRLVIVGRAPPGGRPSPGLDAVVTAMQPETGGGFKTLTVQQLRDNAISSREYLQRIEREGTWQLNGSRAFLDQLGRSAGATGTYNNRFPGENNSAGLPPLFVPRPDGDTDPARMTEYTQALTTQMARRNLLGLVNALSRARP